MRIWDLHEIDWTWLLSCSHCINVSFEYMSTFSEFMLRFVDFCQDCVLGECFALILVCKRSTPSIFSEWHGHPQGDSSLDKSLCTGGGCVLVVGSLFLDSSGSLWRCMPSIALIDLLCEAVSSIGHNCEKRSHHASIVNTLFTEIHIVKFVLRENILDSYHNNFQCRF